MYTDCDTAVTFTLTRKVLPRMDHQLSIQGSYAGSQDAETSRERAEALRCGICRRRLGKSLFFLEETGDVPQPRQSWTLCEECHNAVHLQLAQASWRSPLRLRVAIGLVSTERTPEARRANFGEMTDANWAKLFFWLFPITMLIHLAVIVAIAGFIK